MAEFSIVDKIECCTCQLQVLLTLAFYLFIFWFANYCYLQVDFSLSFLDDFVSEALESGSLPYRTASLRLSQTTSQKKAKGIWTLFGRFLWPRLAFGCMVFFQQKTSVPINLAQQFIVQGLHQNLDKDSLPFLMKSNARSSYAISITECFQSECLRPAF